MTKLKIATIFSGIGSFEQALHRLDIPHKILFAADNGGINIDDFLNLDSINHLKEFEKLIFIENFYKKLKKKNFVKQSYLANYNLNETDFYSDVRFLGGFLKEKYDELDILVGGSPCQSFSTIGNRGGFEDTRGTLFFEYARLVKELKPKCFIYENVKGLTNHDKGKTFEIIKNTFNELGYYCSYQILNAKDFNIPQNRQRIFIVGFLQKCDFTFPDIKTLEYNMGDFLFGDNDAPVLNKNINFDNFVSHNIQSPLNVSHNIHLEHYLANKSKYHLSQKLIDNYIMVDNKNNKKLYPTINTVIAKTLLASMHKQHRATQDNYVSTPLGLRRLMPREALRLMGFPDTFKQVVSDVQMYKQAGNSIVVDVLMAILKNIKTHL
jgi:DNA (cytosine-5)-methyltransferase 1